MGLCIKFNLCMTSNYLSTIEAINNLYLIHVLLNQIQVTMIHVGVMLNQLSSFRNTASQFMQS
ncbi:hypothetical protein LCGC14_0762700 [marine sediment metagenome]|uniref:Uncharacterized protein n=1 Tax=marine sediment metagenome TaxID=412755 RepID=A0A0F9Q4S7_9ZZZZ